MLFRSEVKNLTSNVVGDQRKNCLHGGYLRMSNVYHHLWV